MRKALIASAARTPIGDFRGTLSTTPADVLGSIVIAEVVARAGLGKDAVDEVIMGNVLPHNLGQNPARQAMIKAGIHMMAGGLTVNKVCGSGLKSIMLGAQAIQCGDAEVVVAGGMENMDLAPYMLPKARTGYRMGNGTMIDAMVHDGLWDVVNDFHMGMTAELVTDKFDISREAMDAFAAASYTKALEAQAAGLFEAEIVPVPVRQRRGDPVMFTADETPKPTSLETLAKLRPAFKRDGGTVTAGNASKISDGAAAVLLVSEDYARAHGLTVLAEVVAQGSAGVALEDVLVAPIVSIPRVLKKAGMDESDIALHEINEAFATSSVAIGRELGIDDAKVNVHGGSIAMGHPIGASGARLMVTMLYAMAARDADTGMTSLCLGGGEAVSMIVKRA